MEEIQAAVQRFLDLERQLNAEFVRISPDGYNATLRQLQSYCAHPKVRLVYAPRTAPWSGEKAERMAKLTPPDTHRVLCKVSRYASDSYPHLYAVYLSSSVPRLSDRVDYQKCYWWSRPAEGTPGIVADYTWPFGEAEEKSWFFHSGDDSVSFATLNSPEEIVRLVPPVSEAAALRDYRAEK